MRKKLIAGNWKMNLDWNEAMTLFAELIQYEKSNDTHADIAVFPPSLYLRHFYELAQDRKSSISVGAQDCSAQVKGAYTGELAASMIHSVGAKYCLVGHSERREYHRESNDILSEKVERLLEADIIPVFCCGESLADRDSDNQTFVIDNQLDGTIFELSTEQFEKIVIAYEPVWAIGTGETASADQAQEMHDFIRKTIAIAYNDAIAQEVSILYGGSVKPANAVEIFSKPDVDGGLIGGAALVASDFAAIVNAFN